MNSPDNLIKFAPAAAAPALEAVSVTPVSAMVSEETFYELLLKLQNAPLASVYDTPVELHAIVNLSLQARMPKSATDDELRERACVYALGFAAGALFGAPGRFLASRRGADHP